MELDKYIKKVLIDKNVKQVELAEKLNISRASLGGLISRNKMGVDKLEDIATALNCELKISFIDKETGKEYWFVCMYNYKYIFVQTVQHYLCKFIYYFVCIYIDKYAQKLYNIIKK